MFFCCSLLVIHFPLLQHGCFTGCSPFRGCICSIVGSPKAAVPSGFVLGPTGLTNCHPQAAVPSGFVPAPLWALHSLQSFQECICSSVAYPQATALSEAYLLWHGYRVSSHVPSSVFFHFSFISPLSCSCHSVLNMHEQSHHMLL